MLMVELHRYPVDELSYVSSGELMGPEELDDFLPPSVLLSPHAMCGQAAEYWDIQKV